MKKSMTSLMVIAILTVISACGGGNAASSAMAASSSSAVLSSSASSAQVSTSAASMSSASSASIQTAPGTASNPVLSASEAALFTKANYLAYSGTVGASVTSDAWNPATTVDTSGCATGTCLVVGTGQTYTTIQAAVQAASVMTDVSRVYIKVLPGSYAGPVIVPSVSGGPAITMFGSSTVAGDIRITATLSASMTGNAYSSAFSSLFSSSDKAYSSYSSCAGKGSSTIGTSCATVLWSLASQFELSGITVENTTAHSSGTSQAVALSVSGDKTRVDNVRLISRQDTFLLNTSSASTIARAYVSNSYVEGDVDFVFGRASAVFENVIFKSVSDRSSSSYVFAPSTVARNPYGFLATNCTLTTDSGFSGTALLGRSWDEGSSSTGYVAGSTPNGQLVIRESSISAGFKAAAPWGSAATSKRAFSGNSSSSRDLNDSAYNRMWQFGNTGAGASN